MPVIDPAAVPVRTGSIHPAPFAAMIAGPTGHRLDNRTDRPARTLVIGTRNARDRAHCTDHDLITEKDGPARRHLRRDGTPHPERTAP